MFIMKLCDNNLLKTINKALSFNFDRRGYGYQRGHFLAAE